MRTSLFYKNVTILDYAYYDALKGPLGDSLFVDVEFEGELDAEGILFDFSYAKKAVKQIIDREVDHRFVVPRSLISLASERISFVQEVKEGHISYEAPLEGFCLLDQDVVNLHTLKLHLEMILIKEMPKQISKVVITLSREEDSDHAGYFQYTHGLKSHYGNCQRLIHGHRNSIKFFSNGERQFELEKKAIKEWFNESTHFVFKENISDLTEHEVTLSYRSLQGLFELKIPCSLVYLMEEESTVENLSRHFLERLKKENPGLPNLEVMAFEGIAKGGRSR